jgi:hypothetical protein
VFISAHWCTDDLRGEARRDVVHELDVALTHRAEDLAADRTDLVLHPRDRPGLEAGEQRPPELVVDRRVHREQHLALHLEPVGRDVLDHDAAEPGREQLGVAGHVHNVGVLEHRPVPGVARHLLPVHGVGPPQLREVLVRRPGEERVG